MGFRVLIFVLAPIQHTWPAQTNTQTGSSKTYRYKLATEITKQLCKAGLSHFLYIQPLCGYSFLCLLKGRKRREDRRQKERVVGGTERFECRQKNVENERSK